MHVRRPGSARLRASESRDSEAKSIMVCSDSKQRKSHIGRESAHRCVRGIESLALTVTGSQSQHSNSNREPAAAIERLYFCQHND